MTDKEYFYEFGKMLYKIDGFYAEYAKECDVKENLLWLLYALSDGKKHSQKEICDSWDLPRSTINTIAKELENSGYISFHQIKGESRELNIELTDSGSKYTNKLLKDLFEIEKRAYELLLDDKAITKMEEVLNALKKAKEKR